MKRFLLAVACIATIVLPASGQILLSGGLTYSQNFDSLASGPTSSATWADNTTMPGWYAARAYTGGTAGPLGSYPYVSYRVTGGEQNSGWMYSFGTNGVNSISERAFGSLSSGTPKTNAFGVRIQNDTAQSVGNILISYTGEQWRMGAGNVANINRLYFGYQVSSSAITDPGPNNTASWTAFSALDFTAPIMAATTTDPFQNLDGNAGPNRVNFSSILLTGVTLSPGQEIFLRWIDPDETGNDMSMGVDDFSVSFTAIPEPAAATICGLALLGLVFRMRQRS